MNMCRYLCTISTRPVFNVSSLPASSSTFPFVAAQTLYQKWRIALIRNQFSKQLPFITPNAFYCSVNIHCQHLMLLYALPPVSPPPSLSLSVLNVGQHLLYKWFWIIRMRSQITALPYSPHPMHSTVYEHNRWGIPNEKKYFMGGRQT